MKHIPPIQPPTVREKVIEQLKLYDYDCSATKSIAHDFFADRIIEIVKGGSDGN